MTIDRPYQQTSTARDFFTYGSVGVDLQRAAERREAERLQDRVAAELPPSLGRLARVGSMLIRAGQAIAGTTPTPAAAPDASAPTLSSSV